MYLVAEVDLGISINSWFQVGKSLQYTGPTRLIWTRLIKTAQDKSPFWIFHIMKVI